MIWNIIVLLVIGLVAGLIARAVIPGKQNLSILATIVLGIIGSIIGAIVVLGVYVAVTGRRGARHH